MDVAAGCRGRGGKGGFMSEVAKKKKSLESRVQIVARLCRCVCHLGSGIMKELSEGENKASSES